MSADIRYYNRCVIYPDEIFACALLIDGFMHARLSSNDSMIEIESKLK